MAFWVPIFQSSPDTNMAREMTPGNSPDQFSRIQQAEKIRGETRWIPNRLVQKVENPSLNQSKTSIDPHVLVSHVSPILAGFNSRNPLNIPSHHGCFNFQN